MLYIEHIPYKTTHSYTEKILEIKVENSDYQFLILLVRHELLTCREWYSSMLSSPVGTPCWQVSAGKFLSPLVHHRSGRQASISSDMAACRK